MNRHDLVETSQTIERLLDAHQYTVADLHPDGLSIGLDAELAAVIDRLLAAGGLTREQVAAHLTDPTGDTVTDLVTLADELLTGTTRATYMSNLRFFADGWRILPEQLDDAIAAARQAELRIVLSANPDDHPQIDLPIGPGKRLHRHLVLWPGYGELPIARVLRAKIELAGKYKRAATLSRAVTRDRKRAEQDLPPLGWTGDGAVAGLYAALSYLYGLARGEGVLEPAVDPLSAVKVPQRGETNRRPQSRDEVRSVFRTAILYGSDPDLDRLLVKFCYHTGCRRAGAINLTLDMLDVERQAVTLVQKYCKRTEVPVCRTLLDELAAFAASRGSTRPDDPVFRVKERDHATDQLRPLSDRHFDTLHQRIQANLAWAAKEGWTVHWARHHAKAEMHDIGGPAVARRFMGHAAGHVSERYGPASFEQVAWAVSQRTGEPHPLAQKPWWLG